MVRPYHPIQSCAKHYNVWQLRFAGGRWGMGGYWLVLLVGCWAWWRVLLDRWCWWLQAGRGLVLVAAG
jgi:hypothetical protein